MVSVALFPWNQDRRLISPQGLIIGFHITINSLYYTFWVTWKTKESETWPKVEPIWLFCNDVRIKVSKSGQNSLCLPDHVRKLVGSDTTWTVIKPIPGLVKLKYYGSITIERDDWKWREIMFQLWSLDLFWLQHNSW